MQQTLYKAWTREGEKDDDWNSVVAAHQKGVDGKLGLHLHEVLSGDIPTGITGQRMEIDTPSQ